MVGKNGIIILPLFTMYISNGDFHTHIVFSISQFQQINEKENQTAVWAIVEHVRFIKTIEAIARPLHKNQYPNNINVFFQNPILAVQFQ